MQDLQDMQEKCPFSCRSLQVLQDGFPWGVTKATRIQFIDGKCQSKKWKSRKTALSSYYICLSHDLLLMPSGADTHTYTNIRG